MRTIRHPSFFSCFSLQFSSWKHIEQQNTTPEPGHGGPIICTLASPEIPSICGPCSRTSIWRWITLIILALKDLDGEAKDATQPNPNGTEYDNLYLDMNGILHQAAGQMTKVEFSWWWFTILDWRMDNGTDLWVGVWLHWANLLDDPSAKAFLSRDWYFTIDLISFSSDGVAPRAKMNQQRGRRFMKYVEQVEKSPTARDWDSNVSIHHSIMLKSIVYYTGNCIYERGGNCISILL